MAHTAKTFDLFAPWSQPQQAFWERWRTAMEKGAPDLASAGPWELALEVWKAAIYSGLESQLTVAEIGKEWICTHDANNPEITLGTCQSLHFLEDWTRAQMQLWDGWFAALEGLAPGLPPAEAKQVTHRPHHQAHRHGTLAQATPTNGVAS